MDLLERNEANPHRHPWELSRSQCLLDLLRPNPRHTRYADIGAGDQYFTSELLPYTDEPVHAVDVHYPRSSASTRILQHQDVRDIPPQSIEGLLLLDVLEHVEDDSAFLAGALRALKEGGQALITVPAHPFLFSEHDVFLKHARRYRHGPLVALARSHHLQIQEDFYFYTGLLLIRLAQVLLRKLLRSPSAPHGLGRWRFHRRHWVTRFLVTILNLDFRANRLLGKLGIRLGGLSICLIGRKKSAS